MPKIMTKQYENKKFFIPYSLDKTEGVWVRPLTRALRDTLQREAMLEAGMDTQLGQELLSLKVLQACVLDWKGARDTEGKDIPFSKESIREMWKYDLPMTEEMLRRVMDVARCGELAEVAPL